MSFASIGIGTWLVAGVGAAGIGAGLYEANQANSIATQGLGLAEQTQAEQMQSYQQLQALMNDPASFFQSPVYQAAFNQGSAAVSRSANSQYGPNSSAEQAQLQTFGQSFGQQQLLSQEQLLAQMSGTTAPSSPASAIGAATGANANSFNSLGTLLAALGQTAGGGFFGGGGGAVDSFANTWGQSGGYSQGGYIVAPQQSFGQPSGQQQ